MHFAFMQPPKEGSKWGSAEERHRLLCFTLLALRFLYYHENFSAVTDFEYDLMEKYLYWFECQYQVTHANSPWRTVGSSVPTSYPQTSLRIAQSILDGKLHKSVYCMDFNQEWKNFLHAVVIKL